MIPWTTEETFLLVSLWPTASATQISRWLNRSRSSICAKAMRLRHDDLLPDGVEKHFEVKPVQTRPGRARRTVTSIMPQKPGPPPARWHRAAAGHAALRAGRARRDPLPLAAR
jgi:hypothetical protein